MLWPVNSRVSRDTGRGRGSMVRWSTAFSFLWYILSPRPAHGAEEMRARPWAVSGEHREARRSRACTLCACSTKAKQRRATGLGAGTHGDWATGGQGLRDQRFAPDSKWAGPEAPEIPQQELGFLREELLVRRLLPQQGVARASHLLSCAVCMHSKGSSAGKCLP